MILIYMNIKCKYDIINYLGKEYNYSSFLEISSFSTGHAYDKVSDTIFNKELFMYIPTESYGQKMSRRDTTEKPITYQEGLTKFKDRKFDVVFVDPWHTFEQSKLDIENAFELVSDNGIIVIHDCAPLVPGLVGDYKRGSWCGQTYEAFIDFNINHPNTQTFVVNLDYGCGIIKKNSTRQPPYKLENNLTLKDVAEWNYFDKNRKKLLNLINADEFKKMFTN